MRLGLLFLLFALLSGCGLLGLSNDADLSLFTDREAYTLDDDLELWLTNGTAHTVGFNLCVTTLERRAGVGWTEVPAERVCTAELRLASPDTHVMSTFAVAGYFEGVAFRPGAYRLTAEVEVDETRRTLSTGAFTITE